MRVAEASVLVVLLDAAAAEIAELFQFIQGTDDRSAAVLADRVQAADGKRPRLRIQAETHAEQAQRLQAETFVFENLVVDSGEWIFRQILLKRVARFSSPLWGCQSRRGKPRQPGHEKS